MIVEDHLPRWHSIIMLPQNAKSLNPRYPLSAIVQFW